MTVLPVLPASLETLYCSHNPLEDLIPFKFWAYQPKHWFAAYKRDLRTAEYQEKIIANRGPAIVKELDVIGYLHPTIKEKYMSVLAGHQFNFFE